MNIRFSTKLILAVCAQPLLCASTRAGSNWYFEMRGDNTQMGNAATGTINHTQTIVFTGPSPTISGTFLTPDRKSAGSFVAGAGHSSAENYNSFSQLQSANDRSAWSLSATQSNVTSAYSFSPDLSGINSALLPTFKLASPLQGSGTDLHPTFQWADSGQFPDIDVQLFNNNLSTFYHEQLPASQTSWSPPAALPPDLYTIIFQLVYIQSVPLQPVLLSGPDLGLPDSENFVYDTYNDLHFTALPEPTSLAMFVAAPLLLMRRSRSILKDAV